MEKQQEAKPTDLASCVRCTKEVEPRLLSEEERKAQNDTRSTHVCPNCMLPGIVTGGFLRPYMFNFGSFFI